jgi:ribosome assembly protein 4
VTGSKDTSIRVWDAVTRQTLFSMSSHTLAVSCVRWGGDGLIYSGSKDCTINVWSGAVRTRVLHDMQLSHCP